MSLQVDRAIASVVLVCLAMAAVSCQKPKQKSVKASGHQINNAAYWDGALWYAETEGTLTESGQASAKSWLIRLPAGANQTAKEVSALPIIEPWFLPGTDRLWILSSDSVGHYSNGKVEFQKLASPLGKVSRPFLYGGRPALIACETPGYRLMVWEADQWQPKQKLRMKLRNESDDCSGEYVQAFECDGVVHVFCQVPLVVPVYHHCGLPLADANQTWRKVADAGGQWKATCLDGNPAFFYHTDRGGLAVLGLICRDGQGWQEFFSRSIGLDIGLGVCPTGKGEDFILLRRILPFGMKVVAVENGQPTWGYEGQGKTNVIEEALKP